MIVCVIQARNGSSRLPGKVLRTLPESGDVPVLQHVISRVQRSHFVNDIVVATTERDIDIPIVDFTKSFGVSVFSGSEDNVLERFYFAIRELNPSHVVRITGDCPCLDSDVLDTVIYQHLNHNNDYTTNALNRTFPHGLDIEVFRYALLEEAFQCATEQYEKEHVTPYMYKTHKNKFRIENIECSLGDYKNIRITLDTWHDYVLLDQLFLKLGNDFSLVDIIELYNTHTPLFNINSQVVQKKVYETKEEEWIDAIELLKKQDMHRVVAILRELGPLR